MIACCRRRSLQQAGPVSGASRDALHGEFGMTDHPSPAHLSIGALARQCGINPKTIRFYEQIGVLPPPQRTSAGYRLYGPKDRERLLFIAKAKQVGLTLAEIGHILALRESGTEPGDYVRALIDRKLADVDGTVQRLSALRLALVAVEVQLSATTDGASSLDDVFERYW
jgi:DNA-binding transcriptional MerR regulator